jgi:hypothetical protein
MEGVVMGAAAGLVVVWIILSIVSEGPTLLPTGGLIPGSGPGCLVCLLAYLVGGGIGALMGMAIMEWLS